MLLVEEDMWQQRSRNYWLKSGDRNTSFFHTKASNKHQRNIISRIKNSNNVWQEDEEIMGRTLWSILHSCLLHPRHELVQS